MPLEKADIESIYKLSGYRSSIYFDENQNHKLAKISFVTEDGDTVLRIPIERKYYNELPLWPDDSKSGKVVEHCYFVLREEHKGKGIGEKVNKKEFIKYKEKEIDQVQLCAAWDGLTYWAHRRFKYVSREEEKMLLAKLKEYLINIKKISEAEYDAIKFTSIANIERKYFYMDDGSSFTDWLVASSYGNKCLRMYRDII